MTPDYTAFQEELEKLAFKGLVSDLAVLGRRMARPISGMKEGWKALEPVADPKRMAHGKSMAGRAWKNLFGQGEHLVQNQLPLNDPKSLITRGAEELSRRGWTGSGRASKYIPLGGKSQMLLGTAAGAPSVVKAVKDKEDVGGAVGENLGFGLGGVLTGGTGMAAIPLTIAASSLGRSVGGAGDRLARRAKG